MKISFKKITTKKVLVYDYQSIKFAKKLFHSKFEVYHTRYEEINFLILIKSILELIKNKSKLNLKNLKTSYKKIFFNIVKPKIVYTSIDNNPGFFKLKPIYPSAIYVADQNGMRDNIFYNYAKNYYKKHHKKLTCDYFFVFGEDYRKKISKILNAKCITAGNTINNFYSNKKISKIKKRNILFISSGFRFNHFERDMKVLKNLCIFCKKYSYTLYLLTRLNNKFNNKYYNHFKSNNLEIIESKNRKDSYEYIKRFSLIAFHHSTLGYEALSKGIKVISFGHNYINKIYKEKKTGPFWSSFKYNEMERLIFKVVNYKKKRWKSICKYYSKKILYFDRNNKRKYRLLKPYLN